MYERFFGLQARPFDLTTNPRFLYRSVKHKEALNNLRYGIFGRQGIAVLIGEAGTGKTTVIRTVLASFTNPNTRIVYVGNPLLTRSEFFELLASGFELSKDATTSKTQFLLELSRMLTERYEAGHISALIIDEAQSLPHDLLEEVRLLTNLETSTEKLLPVVLAGQGELATRLNEDSMRQLKQRISLRHVLVPFDLHETAAYMDTRLRLVGGDIRQLFTPAATALIYERSRGIPRVVSVICDNALLGAFAAKRRPVDKNVVVDVCRDFDFQPLVRAAPFELKPASLAATPSGHSAGSRAQPHPPTRPTPFILLPTAMA
jgi:type II secretory pathway predicted ATPase ExeA